MIVAIADIYAQLGLLDNVRELMAATQVRVREEPGCVSYLFAEVVDDPGHFVAVEEWRDQAALDEHFHSPSFKEYQEQIGEWLVRKSELRLHQVSGTVLPQDSAPMDPRLAD
jgi:quinol monooxygenase YgiN